MHQPIVALEQVRLTLTSRAGPVEILRDVSLDVEEGQSLAIVGPSGSGKTSLLMVVAGLERATSGGVRVAGHDLTRLNEDKLALVRGANIGIVFQSFHLVPTMTALENVALPLEFAGDSNAFEIARALLEEVGLAPRVDHFPAQLSGGEQQRVAIARAIAKNPAVLLCDEPTGALDSKTGIVVLEALERVNAELGTTTVIITHNSDIASMADRVIHLSDGQISTIKVNETRKAASELHW